MNETKTEQLIRQNLRLRREAALLRIFCAIALTSVFLAGFYIRALRDSNFRAARALREERAQLAEARQMIMHHADVVASGAVRARMDQEIAETAKKAAEAAERAAIEAERRNQPTTGAGQE